MTFLFYRHDLASERPQAPVLPEGMTIALWKPATDGFPPRRSSTVRNVAWWGLDRLGMFAGGDFAEVSIWRGDRLLHRLIVTPRWHRFPFMDRSDLQLGDLWTDPDQRGKGLARLAVRHVHHRFSGHEGRIWYVVDQDNRASVGLIESCGYRLVGRGRRTSRFGIRLLGQFRMD